MQLFIRFLILFLAAPSFTFAATARDAEIKYLEKNFEEALAIAKPLAEKGCAEAQYTLGNIYNYKNAALLDPYEAVKWYQAAAEKNYAPAQLHLAIMYKRGAGGLARDLEEANRLIHLAAEQGHELAEYLLALQYESRTAPLGNNDAEAFKWFSRLAEQGNHRAQLKLGEKYSTGTGVAQNLVQAYKWLSLSRDGKGRQKANAILAQLSSSETNEAKRMIQEWQRSSVIPPPLEAECITDPVVAESASFQKAGCQEAQLTNKDYYQAQAVAGNAEAQYLLSEDLQRQFDHLARWRGNSAVKSLLLEAQEWRNKAAAQGHLDAQKKACSVKNIQACIDAANAGYPPAQGELGSIYFKGLGVPKDDSNAYFWYNLSGSYGAVALKKISGTIKPDDISSAQKRLAEWRPILPNRITLPVNVAGLLCEGEADGCAIADTCGSLLAITCPKRMHPYHKKYQIADKVTKQVTRTCDFGKNGAEDCEALVPKEWTCASPKNMPLGAAEAEKYAPLGSRSVVSCGDILGVDYDSARHGPYFFIQKSTGEKIGECNVRTGCSPPAAWSCGTPSNYN